MKSDHISFSSLCSFFLGGSWFFFLVAGCATRQLPPFEHPLPHHKIEVVRTTAYSAREPDHRRYGHLSAQGTRLRARGIKSAAADWARWPLGTRFKILSTHEVFQIDDYGWALAGRNTIDLYRPSAHAAERWGVRWVKIKILKWGSRQESYRRLSHLRKYPHTRRMFKEMNSF